MAQSVKQESPSYIAFRISALNHCSHIHQVVTHVAFSNQWCLDQMVLEMISCPDVKNSVQLLKRPSLCLRQTEPCEHETEEIPSSVPAEGTLWCKGFLKRWPSQREKEVEAPACGCCERHAGIANSEWLYLVSRRTHFEDCRHLQMTLRSM